MSFKNVVGTFIFLIIYVGVIFMALNNFNVGYKWITIMLLSAVIGLLNELWGEE